MHGPRDDGTLGLPHLQRWSEARPKRRFAWIQDSLPLFDAGRLIVAFIAIVLLIGIGLGSVLAWRQLSDSPEERAASSLGEIVTLHAQANASSDPSTRYSLLVEAEASAVEALESAPAEQLQSIQDEYASIKQDLDRLTRMVRLESVQPVGAVPAPTHASLPALFTGNGRTYLLADALYEVEVASNQLVELLRPGETVAGAVVGPLLAGTWRGDGPVVVDAERAYVFDSVRGIWDWEQLGTLEDLPVTSSVTAAGVFDLNLYLLDGAGGRIMKFSGGDYESQPEDWAVGVAVSELQNASDIYIDGNIYVLQPDGTILRFFLNNLESLIQPNIEPAFDSATAFMPAGSGFLVVNGSDGRVAQLGRDGTLIQQFRLADPDVDVGTLRDITVDESTGIALLLTAEALYTTRLIASQP